MVSNQAPSSTRLDPKIRYYIYRNNENTIVPLIPADQLPFRLKDFPPSLEHKQLAEGGWKFLNETSEIPFPLPLLNPYVRYPNTSKLKKASIKARKTTKDVSESDDSMADVSDEEELSSEMSSTDVNLAAQTQIEGIPRHLRAARIPARSRPTYVRVQSLTDSMAAIYTQDARKFGYNKTMPKRRDMVAQEEREYCRRWIKTGGCIHTAKGCWYRHEMPSLEKLKEIGIMRIPQWYREKNRSIPKISLLKSPHVPGSTSTSDSHIAKAEKAQALGKANGHRVIGPHGIYTTDTANELMLMDMDDTSSESQRVPIAAPASNSSDNLHSSNGASRLVETPDRIADPLPASVTKLQRSESSPAKDTSEAPLLDWNDPHKDAPLDSVAKRERSKAASSNTMESTVSDELPVLMAVSALEISSKPNEKRSDVPHYSSQANKKTRRTCTQDADFHTPTVLSLGEKKANANMQCDANLRDPTLHMSEDRAAKTVRISAKRKVLPRKTCKVQIRQNPPKPRHYISKERGGTDVTSTTVGEAPQAVVAL